MRIFASVNRWMRGLRRSRQRVTLSVARHLLNIRMTAKEAYDPKQTRRVLVLMPDRIGESLMSTAFVNTVKAHRPDINITVASGPTARAMLAGCAGVDQFIATDETVRRGRRMKLLSAEIERRKDKFCLVVEMRVKINPKVLSFLARTGAEHCLGYDKYGYKIFDLNVPHNPTLHTLERWFVAAQITIGQDLQKPNPLQSLLSLPVDKAVESEIESWLNMGSMPAPRVLLNFYANARDRSFRYAEAIKLLRLWRSRFPDHLLLLLPVPGHEVDVGKIASGINDPKVMIAPQPLLLPTSIALARRVDLIFTPDTGMAHIASALNAPVVVVYRHDSENFERWKPLSDRQGVIFTRPPISPHDYVYPHEFDDAELLGHVERLLPSSFQS